MEFRVILIVLGFASSVFSELNGDQQNNFNYQPNEGQSQQGFGQNVYGNKIPQGETKPTMHQGELPIARLPMTPNGIPYATPFYGQFQPMQQIQGSSHPEATSEPQPAATPLPQKSSTTTETYNHLALPAQYPNFAPRPLGTPSTLAPHTAYGNNALSGSKAPQLQNQNGNVLAKPVENSNTLHSPLTYTYPVPIPMPFPSYFPYPQMQYPR